MQKYPSSEDLHLIDQSTYRDSRTPDLTIATTEAFAQLAKQPERPLHRLTLQNLSITEAMFATLPYCSAREVMFENCHFDVPLARQQEMFLEAFGDMVENFMKLNGVINFKALKFFIKLNPELLYYRMPAFTLTFYDDRGWQNQWTTRSFTLIPHLINLEKSLPKGQDPAALRFNIKRIIKGIGVESRGFIHFSSEEDHHLLLYAHDEAPHYVPLLLDLYIQISPRDAFQWVKAIFDGENRKRRIMTPENSALIAEKLAAFRDEQGTSVLAFTTERYAYPLLYDGIAHLPDQADSLNGQNDTGLHLAIREDLHETYQKALALDPTNMAHMAFTRANAHGHTPFDLSLRSRTTKSFESLMDYFVKAQFSDAQFKVVIQKLLQACDIKRLRLFPHALLLKNFLRTEYHIFNPLNEAGDTLLHGVCRFHMATPEVTTINFFGLEESPHFNTLANTKNTLGETCWDLAIDAPGPEVLEKLLAYEAQIPNPAEVATHLSRIGEVRKLRLVHRAYQDIVEAIPACMRLLHSPMAEAIQASVDSFKPPASYEHPYGKLAFADLALLLKVFEMKAQQKERRSGRQPTTLFSSLCLGEMVFREYLPHLVAFAEQTKHNAGISTEEETSAQPMRIALGVHNNHWKLFEFLIDKGKVVSLVMLDSEGREPGIYQELMTKYFPTAFKFYSQEKLQHIGGVCGFFVIYFLKVLETIDYHLPAGYRTWHDYLCRQIPVCNTQPLAPEAYAFHAITLLPQFTRTMQIMGETFKETHNPQDMLAMKACRPEAAALPVNRYGETAGEAVVNRHSQRKPTKISELLNVTLFDESKKWRRDLTAICVQLGRANADVTHWVDSKRRLDFLSKPPPPKGLERYEPESSSSAGWGAPSIKRPGVSSSE